MPRVAQQDMVMIAEVCLLCVSTVVVIDAMQSESHVTASANDVLHIYPLYPDLQLNHAQPYIVVGYLTE